MLALVMPEITYHNIGRGRSITGSFVKFRLKSFVLVLATVAACGGGGKSAIAQPTFNITPSAVSNTYSGVITLQIGNLTAGDTVVVQKFLDSNTNGIVDAGDLLVQQFNLTDGQAGMVIGGVTNINVPGDTDGAANGQITATLNFQNGDFVQNIIGKYLFKFSSPPAFHARDHEGFHRHQFPLRAADHRHCGQQRHACSQCRRHPVSRAARRQSRAGKSAGRARWRTIRATYTIQAPPGTYVPMAFRSNYVANYPTSPVLALGSGQTITTNLTLTAATASISGQMVDANNSSIGLPGVFMPAINQVGPHRHRFQRHQWQFHHAGHLRTWNVGSDDSGLIVHGYVGYQNGTNVTAGTTGFVGPFSRPRRCFTAA